MTTLLLIDPQVDFHEGGSLPVTGATADAGRTREIILSNLDTIAQIYVTLDSHHKYDIAHPTFWQDKDGNHPPPFTPIKCADVTDGTWLPVETANLEHCLWYLKELEKTQRFVHCLWPEHCLIGTCGHAVHPLINEALQAWAGANHKTVKYVMKGEDNRCEMYSVFKAEVPLPDNPATQLNRPLIAAIRDASGRVLIGGQALSHCVNHSTRDLAANWPQERMSDLCILTDCASPVPGFEAEAQTFLEDMRAAGLTLLESGAAFT